MNVPLLLVLLIVVLLVSTKAKSAARTMQFVFSQYGDTITSYSRTYALPVNRVCAIISVESAGNSEALGAAGEVGLMQMTLGALTDFNGGTGKNYDLIDLRDPQKSIEAGTWYLGHLRDAFGGNIDLATQAYNAGIGRVRGDHSAGAAYLNKIKAFEKTFTVS